MNKKQEKAAPHVDRIRRDTDEMFGAIDRCATELQKAIMAYQTIDRESQDLELRELHLKQALHLKDLEQGLLSLNALMRRLSSRKPKVLAGLTYALESLE